MKSQTNTYVAFLSLVAAIGGILFGYDTAVISGTISGVASQFSLDAMQQGWFVGCALVGSIGGVERALKARLDGQKDATVSLHCDKTVAVDEVVKVMNIAKDNNYKLILATSPK